MNIDSVEKYIDTIIETEKSYIVNPYLKTKVMGGISALVFQKRERESYRQKLILNFCCLALLATTVYVGIVISDNIKEREDKRKEVIYSFFSDDTYVETLYFEL